MPALLTRMSGSPSFFGAMRDHPLDGGRVAKVGAIMTGAELVLQLVYFGGVAEAVEHDPSSRPRKGASDGESDARCGASNESDLAGKTHAHFPFFSLRRCCRRLGQLQPLRWPQALGRRGEQAMRLGGEPEKQQFRG
jgi:hypothetical protein